MKNVIKIILVAVIIVATISCITGQRKRNSYSWQEDLHQRLLTDFCKSEKDIKTYIQKYIPDVTDSQMRKWEDSKALEFKIIDGQKFYFKNAGPNLFRLDPACMAIKEAGRISENPAPGSYEATDAKNLPKIIKSVKATGNRFAEPKKMHVKYTLSVNADAVPEGEIVRCWLPFPRTDNPRQKNIRLINTSEKRYRLAPKGAVHNTLYMQKRAVKGEKTIFGEEFEYVSYGEWSDLSAENVLPYNPGGKGSGISRKEYEKYTEEHKPHIVFSQRMRHLADSLTFGETNPYLQAKKIFRWVNDKFPWASAREYSTIENIPEYVLDNGHGDCGQVSLLFITLCRIKGIPAHFESGFMMHPHGNWNLHDWAEVYFEGKGWVPADQSFGIPLYAAKGSDEEYFFLGGIDSYRMVVNEDFGGRLFPAKIYPRSETVDFQRGEVEWKGGNLYFPQWKYKMEIDYPGDGN
jgi:transglutaminase-like putative cysteine protease